MDFNSESFKDDFIHLSLYTLRENQQYGDLEILNSLQKQFPANLTFVNARAIVSLMHLNIGISRGLVNQRDHSNPDVKNKMRTNNLGQEILYHLTPTHSI